MSQSARHISASVTVFPYSHEKVPKAIVACCAHICPCYCADRTIFVLTGYSSISSVILSTRAYINAKALVDHFPKTD